MMDSENQKKIDVGPVALKETAYLQFHDPEEMAKGMAQVMPGGEYGILPLSKEPFHGEVKIVDFGGGVAMCSAKFFCNINIRADFGRVGNVGFLLPEIVGNQAVLNGKPIQLGVIKADCMDASYNLRTVAKHTTGMVLVEMEAMRELMDIHQHELPLYLRANATLIAEPAHLTNLNGLLIKAAALSINDSERPLWKIERDLLRDRILTELVIITTQGNIKHKHKSHVHQNAAMARIDHYIDAHPFGAIALQDLCMGTALSLRTVQRVIQSRTGLTALAYLRRRKLAFVHQVLCSPKDSTTVTGVAMDFGFLHLGRFSTEYQEMYGERPSTTLSRAKGGALSFDVPSTDY